VSKEKLKSLYVATLRLYENKTLVCRDMTLGLTWVVKYNDLKGNVMGFGNREERGVGPMERRGGK
jgi:hypothetical protein